MTLQGKLFNGLFHLNLDHLRFQSFAILLANIADPDQIASGSVWLMSSLIWAVLQIRRGKRDNLGIIFHVTPLKSML